MNTMTQIRPEQNLLKDKILAYNLPAASEDGAKWMLKALHPAEPSIAGVALPDGTTYDTVPVELTWSQTIGPDLLGTIPSTWGCQCTLMPHPICPMVAIPTGGAAPLVDSVDFTVPMFTAPLFDDDLGLLNGVAQAWRLCALSCTVHLDANATTDSGTVAAAQQVVKPDNVFLGGSTIAGRQHPPFVMYDTRDQPDYAHVMALPRCFQANARGGIYMPLKLTQLSQHWFSLREQMSLVAPGVVSYGTSSQGYRTVGTTTTHAWPFYHLSPGKNDGAGSMVGGITASMMGDNFGTMCFTGLNPAASLVFKIRLCLEYKVDAYSTYAAHLRPPPYADPVALANYTRIVREMPDAFPADYNDGGRILATISGAIRKVSPFLGMIPGYGPLINAAAGPVTGLLDMGADALAARKKKKKAFNAARARVPPQYVPVGGKKLPPTPKRKGPVPPPKPANLR